MKRLRLREVELRNFRCFHRAKVDFEEDTTVVYGGASAGKTALVDALTIGVAGSAMDSRSLDGEGMFRSRSREETRV